ncbi:tetratricopeptide repeat protein, partial [bacterium]|nr:tetratricopeptide repeat protein [bacterium]
QELIEQVDEYLLSHVLDLHAQAQFATARTQEAKQMCESIIDRYFPRTPGSINVMYMMGEQMERENNMDEAEKYYMQVMLQSPYDIWIRRSEDRLKSLWQRNPTTLDQIHEMMRNLMYTKTKANQLKMQEYENRIKDVYEN